MIKTCSIALALAFATTHAMAGGIERANNDYGFLFQSGTQLNVTHALVEPSVSGDYPDSLGGGSTGNMAKSYGSTGFAIRHDLNEKLSFGLYVNQAYGAGANYEQGVYTGLRADWDSVQKSLILSYRLGERFSVFGGLRHVTSQADIAVPELLVRGAVGAYAEDLAAQALAAAAAGDGALALELSTQATTLGLAASPLSNPLGDLGMNYTASGSRTGDFGYVLGAAYEIPDIAMRVSLTWQSRITHEFDTTESLSGLGLIDADGTTEIEMPQSLALDFQTGIAPGTLLFGGVKWTEWSAWEVRSPGYESVTGEAITGFDNDTITWKLGLGRQFSEKFSGFVQASYEAPDGDVASRLSPTDGRSSLGLGGQFTDGMHKLRFGVEYVRLGDAEDSSGTEFDGNSAWGVGLSYTVRF